MLSMTSMTASYATDEHASVLVLVKTWAVDFIWYTSYEFIGKVILKINIV
jgi:hypothetical protein